MLSRKQRVWITIFSAAICLLLRFSGLLQPLEWAALDRFFRLRPWEAQDTRIAIVAIDEADLQQVGQWPLPDRVVAELLQKVSVAKPRAIGLDIYRDLPVPPGQQELRQALTIVDNLIGIEQLGDRSSVAPSPFLDRLDRVGFNNVVLDADGRVRRGLLYWSTPTKLHESFDLKLALTYLQAEAIASPLIENNFQALHLGQAVFHRFQPHDGGYVGADAGGYQILANFRHPSTNFLRVSMSDVLAERVPAEIFRDRIVIIGSTAPSLKDFFYTPDSASPLWGAAQPIAGVELHANFVSQIVSAALGERPLIHVWSDFWESAWIVAWIVVAANLSCRWQIVYSTIYVLLAALGLISITYLAFLQGWWLPVIPPLLALFAVSGLMTAGNAQLQEEFKRSKDFLQGIIDTIPDPIFVKNKKYRWIVLNEAYCRLIGYPLAELIDKSEVDFFSPQEAEVFRQQDDLVFRSNMTMEHEEEFSDASGTTHLISTKRSLHRDAAGNLYLVGVIRDITARKLLEEELKRQTADLVQYNTELQLSEQRLRHLALHDPLTGLPNRQLFLEHLNQSIAWAQSHQLLVGLLYIDLDGFKQVNDTLGHDWGDRLLVAVSQRLSGCLRHSDIVSRLGGDEFTVILPAIPEVSVAEKVANKILATLSEVFALNEQALSITASVGIGVYPLHCDTIDSLIKQADTAMYRAKQLGKNCYQIAVAISSQTNL
ncbi:CHASE2 domain-containing protein [Chroococcidiopsidales cyanobacterium LEGE 13417]|nr:CHASE2 domain-containing protein [Chroococcidiopsidales cyanobacterium LEGE 13417]